MTKDKPLALSNGEKPVVMDNQEDAIMNGVVHNDEYEYVDHEQYDLDHAEHEDNQEWEMNEYEQENEYYL